jgi:hypothetical protein
MHRKNKNPFQKKNWTDGHTIGTDGRCRSGWAGVRGVAAGAAGKALVVIAAEAIERGVGLLQSGGTDEASCHWYGWKSLMETELAGLRCDARLCFCWFLPLPPLDIVPFTARGIKTIVTTQWVDEHQKA